MKLPNKGKSLESNKNKYFDTNNSGFKSDEWGFFVLPIRFLHKLTNKGNNNNQGHIYQLPITNLIYAGFCHVCLRHYFVLNMCFRYFDKSVNFNCFSTSPDFVVLFSITGNTFKIDAIRSLTNQWLIYGLELWLWMSPHENISDKLSFSLETFKHWNWPNTSKPDNWVKEVFYDVAQKWSSSFLIHLKQENNRSYLDKTAK